MHANSKPNGLSPHLIALLTAMLIVAWWAPASFAQNTPRLKDGADFDLEPGFNQPEQEETDKTDKPIDPAAKLDARQKRLWDRYWPTFAKKYVRLNGAYLCMPNYSTDFPSSRRVTADEAQRVLIREWGKPRGFNILVDIARYEAQAIALPLPEIVVGQYGYVLSGKIEDFDESGNVKISQLHMIHYDEMEKRQETHSKQLGRLIGQRQATNVVENKYYKAQRTLAHRHENDAFKQGFILAGMDTEQLKIGQRFRGNSGSGFQVAIVKLIRSENNRHRKRFIAVLTEQFDKGLPQDQFVEVLDRSGLTVEQFTNLIVEELRRDPGNAESSVLTMIEEARAERDEIHRAEMQKQHEAEQKQAEENKQSEREQLMAEIEALRERLEQLEAKKGAAGDEESKKKAEPPAEDNKKQPAKANGDNENGPSDEGKPRKKNFLDE